MIGRAGERAGFRASERASDRRFFATQGKLIEAFTRDTIGAAIYILCDSIGFYAVHCVGSGSLFTSTNIYLLNAHIIII